MPKGRTPTSCAGAMVAGREADMQVGGRCTQRKTPTKTQCWVGHSKDPVTATLGEDEIGMGEVQRDLGTGICLQRETLLTEAPGSTC